jgi:hypothetical protein
MIVPLNVERAEQIEKLPDQSSEPCPKRAPYRVSEPPI